MRTNHTSHFYPYYFLWSWLKSTLTKWDPPSRTRFVFMKPRTTVFPIFFGTHTNLNSKNGDFMAAGVFRTHTLLIDLVVFCTVGGGFPLSKPHCPPLIRAEVGATIPQIGSCVQGMRVGGGLYVVFHSCPFPRLSLPPRWVPLTATATKPLIKWNLWQVGDDGD